MPSVERFEAGELTFDQWKALVDEEVTRITLAFTSEDFVDWTFAEAFEDGVEPRDAAHRALAQDHQGRSFLEFAGINPDGIDP